MTDFVEQQAEAWAQVVGRMLDRPVEAVLNGSVNGPGSSLEYTKDLRETLPDLLKKYSVTTMLDAPCGDWTWMSQVDIRFLYSYIGMDSEPRLIQSNITNAGSLRPNCTFIKANLLKRKSFPKVDLILCRDFLAHLPTEWIGTMLEKFTACGAKYLLASNYPGSSNDFEWVPDDYPWLGYMERPHDLTLPPFNLEQIDSIPEQSPPGGVLANSHELGLFILNA
jgi:hypothetical protein